MSEKSTLETIQDIRAALDKLEKREAETPQPAPVIDLQPLEAPRIVPAKPAKTPSKSLFLATPTMNGFKFNWLVSTLKLVDVCRKKNTTLSFAFMEGGSLIPHTRNDLMKKFLASKCSHLLMTDDDIGYDADDVFKMLDTGHDFICGAAPLKMLNKEFAGMHMDSGDFDPEKHLAKYNVSTRDTGGALYKNDDGTCDITFAGTAFILVSRKAIDDIIEKVKPTVYDNAERTDPTYDMFGLMYTKREDGSLEALGEDVSFCHRYKMTGGQIKLWPNMNLSHCGNYTFHGNFAKSVGAE